jgi:hypothetical protein
VRGLRSAGDLAISWIRRTRLGGDSWDAAEVPLGEETERYEVDILDGPTVKRTLTATSPTVTTPPPNKPPTSAPPNPPSPAASSKSAPSTAAAPRVRPFCRLGQPRRRPGADPTPAIAFSSCVGSSLSLDPTYIFAHPAADPTPPIHAPPMQATLASHLSPNLPHRNLARPTRRTWNAANREAPRQDRVALGCSGCTPRGKRNRVRLG